MCVEVNSLGDRLTVEDGFKFGCGFIAAGCVFYAAAMLVAALVMGLMAVLGMSSLIPQLTNFPK